MLLGIVVMFFGGGVGAAGKEGWALVLFMIGFAMSIIGGIMMPDPPMDRADNARATIAAATAAVTDATAESELLALERAAATAAAAVVGCE
jgi:uncharacterized membrane protein YgaE (UPF0421/DUF939 family)